MFTFVRGINDTATLLVVALGSSRPFPSPLGVELAAATVTLYHGSAIADGGVAIALPIVYGYYYSAKLKKILGVDPPYRNRLPVFSHHGLSESTRVDICWTKPHVLIELSCSLEQPNLIVTLGIEAGLPISYAIDISIPTVFIKPNKNLQLRSSCIDEITMPTFAKS
ncbi:hypothetical protein J6590_049371 [Homalodisca vitripennis]|nr:hypothetical protein J6590_049371 [Homalodisca vitripennis]